MSNVKAESLKICVDSNEASSRRDILNYLRLSGFEVDVQRLPVCDYVISDRCGVERKDANDFLGSVRDGRLFSQAKDMASVYERPILILEGRLAKAFRRSRMKPAAIYGALSSIALDFGFSIIPTEDPDASAVLLHRLAYREQTEEKRVVQIRKVDRRMPVHEQQMFLLTGFPQIGTTLAQDLLTCLDTPYRVIEELARAEISVSASGKTRRLGGPLTEVKGIGPVIVENAQRLLRGSFNANWMAYEEP